MVAGADGRDAQTNGRIGPALAGLQAQGLRTNNAPLLDLLSGEGADAAPASNAVVAVDPAHAAGRREVVVRDAIHRTGLRDIIDSKVLAVRMPGRYTSRQCHR